MAQKWITRDALGRIAGPFDTSEVIQRIHQGLITEEDSVAAYPEGKWISVTKEVAFFDELLNALSGNRRGRSSEPAESPKVTSTNSTSKSITEKSNSKTKSITQTSTSDKTAVLNNDENTKTLAIEAPKDTGYGDETSRITKPIIAEVPSGITTTEKQIVTTEGAKAKASPAALFSQKDVFDIQKHQKITLVEKYNRYFGIAIILMALTAAAYFFWPEKVDSITGDEFKLRPPRFNQNKIARELEESKVTLAYAKIRQGTFADFRDAQNELIQVLESTANNKEALALLCFSYFHLWDYTEKNSRDLNAVSVVTKKATSVDRFGFQGKTCRFVDFMVRAQYQEAQKVVDDVLDSEEGASNVTFSYFNGYLKASRRDLISAEGYLSAAIARSQALSTQTSNNEFTVMWQALADVQKELGKSNEAYKSAQRILAINPAFVDAMLIKGVLEYRAFRKPKVSKSTLQKAFMLVANNKANKKKLSEAYLVLAEVALSEKNRKAALEYAVAAYNYNPGNTIAKNLAIELGGNNKVGRKKVLAQQLVIEGEQSLQESGCATAQAFFKEAYKLDPQNGYAALKTAQCLWELSFSMDAIRWIENAILADPTLIEAYVTAASFYIARYDFDAALKVLLKGRNRAPRSYEIFRGLASLELKRGNPKLAVGYCNEALKIYDADTGTLILMAKALLDLGDNDKAFQYIVRAGENDSRNVEVHTTHGKVLYKSQGIFSSMEYLTNRINSFPLEPAYRVALAEVLYEDQKLQEAERVAREALQFDAKAKSAYMVLGKVLKERGQKDQALNYFLDAHGVDPSDAEPLFEAGKIYIEGRQFDEAIKQFRRILAINPRYPNVYLNMAQVYYAQGKLEEALKEAQEEIRNYPDNYEPYILSAQIYFNLGESQRGALGNLNNETITEENAKHLENEKRATYAKMISYHKLCAGAYQQAIDIAPPQGTVYIDLSRCYRFSGDLDKAQKMVEKAINLEPGNPVVWRENGLIFEQKGDFPLAMEAYKRYLILNPNAKDRDQIVGRMRSLETKID
ncbi:MAG: tetratricopeptide repeat protein [Bdellovibrionaceae bacterium]|nr:tetratricopeptide repeat protein [Pseudobdellovibrionaceae bacterium]